MNSFFAAGLFDSPWMVAVIVIGGALINWLSTRRQKKLASQEAAGEVEPAATSEGQPAGEFNLEAALRRLLGEEPAAESAPPPIPRAAPVTTTILPSWGAAANGAAGTCAGVTRQDWPSTKAERPSSRKPRVEARSPGVTPGST